MIDDLQHWIGLIQKTKVRLQALEDQKAQYGIAAPPHIDTEIARAHKDIELYTAQISSGVAPSKQAQNAVPGDHDVLLLKFRVQLLEQQQKDGLTIIQGQIGHLTEQVTRADATSQTYRATEREIGIAQARKHDERLASAEKEIVTLEKGIGTLSDHFNRLTEEYHGRPWQIALIVALIVTLGSIMTVIAVWIIR